VSAIIIEGRTAAAQIKADVANKAQEYAIKWNRPLGLDVILIGDNPASQVYIRTKQRACKLVGIRSEIHYLPPSISQAEVLTLIHQLNTSLDVQGILLQLPLPAGFDAQPLINAIDPLKDVDGLHPSNLGLLLAGRPNFIPCTPQGCMELIRQCDEKIEGKNAVVVGRSLLVGKSIAALLTNANATVTLAHSKTKNLKELCLSADILVCAIGYPCLITGEYIKPGAIVIDVGISRVIDDQNNSTLKGDVDFESVKGIAGYLTPVPGGVGPLTVAYLLANTLLAGHLQQQQS
jgi:methylenetetrahydrofolate dehydrogenase (NADP+)/methenyltetrahydrofolate cyclohydrolase